MLFFIVLFFVCMFLVFGGFVFVCVLFVFWVFFWLLLKKNSVWGLFVVVFSPLNLQTIF